MDIEARVHAHAPCGLVSFGDDGVVRYANDALHAWLEQPPGGLPGTRFEAMLSPASRVFHSTHFVPLLKLEGAAEEVHFMLRTASGVDVPVLASAVRDIDGDEPLTHCGLITMRRRKEFEGALLGARRAAEAAVAAKDQFLAVVSHELRTPLSAIAGWIRVARSGKVDAAMLDRALEAVDRNVQMQANLIEDLIDVSRIVSGKMRISPRPLNLAPVVEAALDAGRPAAIAKGIALDVALDSDAGVVQADRTRMQQIVWNLVSNAIKFTPRGGHVQVVLSRVGSRVAVSVADDGIGIPADKLPYVFERFWQQSAGGSRETTGLGLGLSICRSLVELHGGSIRAESPGPGQGARFVAEFPIAVAAAGRPAPSDASEAREAPSLDGVRVLVVDDDADARGLLRMLLEGVGARVEAAGSADEAMASMAHAAPDVLVSDVGMPGKDGYALIREVRGARAFDSVAAIAITGLGRPQDRIDLLRAGFQAHVVKPVEPDELIALIHALARR
jgi:signal transduction histidine kinase/CheY-like chemotaxis protein